MNLQLILFVSTHWIVLDSSAADYFYFEGIWFQPLTAEVISADKENAQLLQTCKEDELFCSNRVNSYSFWLTF